MVNIRVLPIKSNSGMKDKDVFVYLLQDNWNDYSFKTLYHLFLSGYYSESGEPIRFGEVKILKKGQTEDDGIQLSRGDYVSLSDDFCSLGQTLDYYERIASLKSEYKEKILKSLNDVIFKPQIKSDFNEESGWLTSLMRGLSETDDIFILSPYLLNRDYNSIPSIELKLSFINGDMEGPITFDFDAPSYGYLVGDKLPCRMNVIVGQNGSGKSSILSKISRVAFASSKDRMSDALSKVGTITPHGIGFPKIISVAYSAFDSFKIPGVSVEDKKQILSDIKSSKGRYVFCGVRDIGQELIEYIESFTGTDILPDDEIINDRLSSTKLKSISSMCDEVSTLLLLVKSKRRVRILKSAISILSKELSFKEMEGSLLEAIKSDSLSKLFFECSTGHKFIIHTIISIIAHAEKRSLILMDEPETHLHPPLLAVFMTSIRYALEEFDSFCIVATHSPIVVQETLSRHVNIIKRLGNKVDITSPDIETYGENLSAITNLVFSLSGDFTQFHEELDKLTMFYVETNKNKTVDYIYKEIEKVFDNGLSMQARSYVMSQIVGTLGG
ncbi:AAA family ATPase [Aeromonas popoffii]|uniref:AAA family ATPase n=1 Tax=Aeromonas popoffii TaxID=70856 RepID=UPI0030CF237A